jgi:tetratricopeptide (TPR) repeat protein
MLLRLGDVALDRNGDAQAARSYFRQGRALQQAIFTHPRGKDFTEPKNKILLSHADVRLGRASLQLGDPETAARHFQQALTFRKDWAAATRQSPSARSYLAEVYLWLGVTVWHRGEAAAVPEYFGQAVRLAEALVAQHPRDAGFKADLAEVYAAHGDAQVRLGQAEAAAKSYRLALASLQAGRALRPGVPAHDALLARIHEGLAGDALRRGQRSEATKHYQEALHLRADLAELEPGNPVRQAAYLLALARVGKHAEAARGAEALRRRAPRSPEILLQVARCYAACARGAGGEEARGYTARALDALQALAALPDYHDAVALRSDPDLAPLRAEPAFQALLRKLEPTKR